MALNLDTFLINLVIHVVINAILLTGVLWISGRLLVGKDKAKFTDALWIAILETVIADVLNIFIVGIIATLIVLFVWIALIKHFSIVINSRDFLGTFKSFSSPQHSP